MRGGSSRIIINRRLKKDGVKMILSCGKLLHKPIVQKKKKIKRTQSKPVEPQKARRRGPSRSQQLPHPWTMQVMKDEKINHRTKNKRMEDLAFLPAREIFPSQVRSAALSPGSLYAVSGDDLISIDYAFSLDHILSQIRTLPPRRISAVRASMSHKKKHRSPCCSLREE